MDSNNQEIKPESAITVDILPPRFAKCTMIGKGGMGVVFRCHDKTLDREVAVKLLSFEGVLDEKVQQRFLQEAKTLTSLDHFNIVKCFDTGLTSNGYPFHVIEYLEGESLSEELEKTGALKPDRFFQIFSQVCQGLAHAHKRNIIHRDLKPGNIIVCNEKGSKRPTVKIIDFGIARIAEEATGESPQSQTTQTLTRTSRLLGSPAYMSPEQCRGAVVDQLSDIYSLGCIMYECLTGTPPFQVRSSMEVMYKHIHEEPPKLEPSAKTPRARQLAAMIDSCLLKDPEFRPTSVDMILDELANVFQSDIEFGEIKTAKKKIRAISPSKIAVFGIMGIALLTGTIFAYRAVTNQHVEVTIKSNLTPDQEQSLLDLKNIEKSIYERLSNPKMPEPRKLENYNQLVKVVAAVAALEMKAGPRARAEATVNKAMDLFKGNKASDKLMRASLIGTLASTTHGANPERAEEDFAEAVKLIQEATGSDSATQQEPLRRTILKFHIGTRDWVKAREDFAVLRKIWDKIPANDKEITEEFKLERCNNYIRSLAVTGFIKDSQEREDCVALCIDFCEYAMKHNDYDVSAHGLIQCIHSLHDAPHDISYYRIAHKAYKLLSEIENSAGDPAGPEHAQEAERLRKLIK